jgi:hypothetical protein
MPRLLKIRRIDEISGVDRGAGDGCHVMLMKRLDPDCPDYVIDKGYLPPEVEAYLKREFSDDKRKELAASGAAMSGGGFPIENVEDLHNAIRAIGRAKNPAAAKAHIRSRAKSLGHEDLIPETWGKRDDQVIDWTKASKAVQHQHFAGRYRAIAKLAEDAGVPAPIIKKAETAITESVASIVDDKQIVDKKSAAERSYQQCIDYLKGYVPKDRAGAFVAACHAAKPTVAKGADLMSDKTTQQMIDDAVAKALDPLAKKVTDLEAENRILKMSEKHQAHHAKLEGKDKEKFAAAEPAERDKMMAEHNQSEKDSEDEEAEKIARVVKRLIGPVLEPLTKQLGDIAKRNETLESDKELTIAKADAKAAGLPEAAGETIMKARKGDRAAVDKMVEIVKGLVEQTRTGKLFAEFGSNKGATGGAYDQLMVKAKELMETFNKAHANDKPMSIHQAFDKVIADPANAELYAQHKTEEMGKRFSVAA